MALEAVGSNPITHPIKKSESKDLLFFYSFPAKPYLTSPYHVKSASCLPSVFMSKSDIFYVKNGHPIDITDARAYNLVMIEHSSFTIFSRR